MEPRRKSRHVPVVVGLMVFATAVGVLAYWRFIVSDRYLRHDIAAMALAGRSLTVEQCVDRTVSWASSCRAMKSLCVATGPHLMRTCLAARERDAYCAKLGTRGEDTHFGFKECEARGVDRKNKKTCAAAYRAIVTHCARERGQR
jgi:hypothetical protein